MPKLKNTLVTTIPAKDVSKWSKWTEANFWKDQNDKAEELYHHVLQCPGTGTARYSIGTIQHSLFIVSTIVFHKSLIILRLKR